MKSKLFILGLVFLFSCSGYVFAYEGTGHDEHMESTMPHQDGPTTTSPQAVEVGNKICPVSEEEIGKMGKGAQHEYNGKIYNFCCLGCLKDFNKNPEQYVKKVEEMMKVKENKGCGCQHKGGQSCSG